MENYLYLFLNLISFAVPFAYSFERKKIHFIQHWKHYFSAIIIVGIIFIGYLTWWNGLKSFAVDKSFRWDEWFWFGILPAVAPYLFYFLWKKKD